MDFCETTVETATPPVSGLTPSAAHAAAWMHVASLRTFATTGLATDPVVAKILNDATCIQAASWAALGIDPLTGGVAVPTVVSQKSIGSAHIAFADAVAASLAKTKAVTELVPEAVAKLSQNNLLPTNVWIYG